MRYMPSFQKQNQPDIHPHTAKGCSEIDQLSKNATPRASFNAEMLAFTHSMPNVLVALQFIKEENSSLRDGIRRILDKTKGFKQLMKGFKEDVTSISNATRVHATTTKRGRKGIANCYRIAT
eukprot:1129075_1